jgi:prepilin-type N-terminal cleavage/methylation domain-containing protein
MPLRHDDSKFHKVLGIAASPISTGLASLIFQFTCCYSCSTTSWLSVNRKRNRLRGFTLIEQIVVLALTTILVLIGFTAILNFQNLLVKVRENAGKDRVVYLLRNVMENDLRNCELVSWDGRLNIEEANGTIRYQFDKSFLIRQSAEVTDTFRFATSNVEISGVNGNNDLVESISFNLSDDIEFYKMSFLKKYPEYKIWEFNTFGN